LLGVAALIFATITLAASKMPGDQDHNGDQRVKDRFVGAWRLVSLEAHSQAFQAAVIDVFHCLRNIAVETAQSFARSAAQRAVELGEQNYRANLCSLRLILNKLMAPIPGEHVIILVSSGFHTWPGGDDH
jgi:hypothetical protein